MARILVCAVMVAQVALIYRLQLRIDGLRAHLPAGYEVLYLPTGKHIQLLSFGYQQLLADVIYLWSIQYTGDTEAPDRFARVEHMYTVISDLDPNYVDPYQVGAMMMVYEMGDLSMAFHTLDRGIKNLPNNWQIPVDAGFYAFIEARNYDLAIHYFRIASERPGAPGVVRRMLADMYRRKGDLATAVAFWEELYRSAPDADSRRIAYNHYFDLTQVLHVKILRQAIDAYSAVYGHRPARLSRLVDAGLLRELPRNLEGSEYLYDPRTGEVKAPAPFKLNRRE
ncbi:MAG: hypothetical protein AB1714_07975 [Acidobacteriota bacterium]